jgi:hypothetical protein
MDGTPIPGPQMYTDNIDSSEGCAAAQLMGYLDLWRPYVTGYQYPIMQYQDLCLPPTKDSDMLIAAKWIKNAPPGNIETEATWYKSYSEGGKEGPHADKYGHTISLLKQLHDVTREDQYIDEARAIADSAREKFLSC